MSYPTYKNKADIKDIKSTAQNELHINVEAPPPPYEAAGGASSSTSSNVDTRIDKSSFNQNSINSIPKASVSPTNNNHLHSYHNNNFQHQHQQQGSTIVYIEGYSNSNPNKKKRTCLEGYWKHVINPNAWKSLFYFLIIAPVVAFFALLWCTMFFFFAIISLMFPPLGFIICVGTAWSFRALGRLELITATMCTHEHKPAHMYHPVFRTINHAKTEKGILRYGIAICLDKYTWMCFVYFVFVNFVCTVITWVLVFALFVLAFSPLMIVAMPLMCIICLNFGKAKVKMSEGVLVSNPV